MWFIIDGPAAVVIGVGLVVDGRLQIYKTKMQIDAFKEGIDKIMRRRRILQKMTINFKDDIYVYERGKELPEKPPRLNNNQTHKKSKTEKQHHPKTFRSRNKRDS